MSVPDRETMPTGPPGSAMSPEVMPMLHFPGEITPGQFGPRSRVPGTTFIDCLEAFQADPETRAVMMIGEIGGSAEEEAAAFIASEMDKPVVAYIAGVTAPEGRKMGHAGAIVSGSHGTAAAKIEALREAGARVAENPTEAGEVMVEIVRGLG